MTTVYFVRHAQANVHNHDDPPRELTEKGLWGSRLVTAYLFDKGLMPWIVKFTFEDPICIQIDQINLFDE